MMCLQQLVKGRTTDSNSTGLDVQWLGIWIQHSEIVLQCLP